MLSFVNDLRWKSIKSATWYLETCPFDFIDLFIYVFLFSVALKFYASDDMGLYKIS